MKKDLIQKVTIGVITLGIGFGSAWTIQNNKIEEVKSLSNKKYAVLNDTMQKALQNAKKQLESQLVEYKGEVTEDDPNFYKEDGSRLFELTDGSWFIINEEKGEYIFQPVDLGDWNYQVDNMEQLENIVKTYISMKNTGTW